MAAGLVLRYHDSSKSYYPAIEPDFKIIPCRDNENPDLAIPFALFSQEFSYPSFCNRDSSLPSSGQLYIAYKQKGGENMKKSLVILSIAGMLLMLTTSIAFADDITPLQYDVVSGTFNANGNGDWWERSQGTTDTGSSGTGYLFEKAEFAGDENSTHPQGTWNSPYTVGVDGYNYNDPQDYVANGSLTNNASGIDQYSAGPHGGYLTSTHKCRECHAVHRAAGKFKLTRADTRFGACDWCHGTGAGSGYNIQMDNDDNYTEEYNVGHSMGFGTSDGKWKAPDDTFPAFTPNYWLGGFACFDCHSPHANPRRLLGFKDDGTVWAASGIAWSIANPGHDNLSTGTNNDPKYPAGSWLLIKNPDREIAVTTDTFSYYRFAETTDTAGTISSVTIYPGQEILDVYAAYQANDTETISAGLMMQYSLSDSERYPVNKYPIDWNTPIGPANSVAYPDRGFRTRVAGARLWNVSEFCTDCHDGNAGLSTVQAPVFSEDRALRDAGAASEDPAWQGNYDLAYGHDSNPRH